MPRSDIVEIGGRLNYAGEELEPLDEEAIRAAARRVRDEGFGAVAVAFLFSYLNPAHELRAGEILAEELDGVSVSLSHRVAREWREYERTSSTVVDAYIAPVVRRYLERLESGDAAARPRRAAPRHAVERRHRHRRSRRAISRLQTLLSGPVGGAMGGVALARILDRPNLIGIDMGGTSFDVSLVVDGKPDVASETTFEGLPAADVGGQHPHHRRRRRLARLQRGGRAARRPAERRRRSRARPATAAAATGRPSPTPTSSSAGSIPPPSPAAA